MYLALAAFVCLLMDFAAMRYSIDSEGIRISTLFQKQLLPWGSISEVTEIRGRPDANVMLGCGWTGMVRGYYNITGIGITDFYGGSLESGALIIKDEVRRVALTPDDRSAFLQAIREHGGPEPAIITADSLMSDEFDDRIDRDPGYKSLLRFNTFLIVALAAYLAAFFPGQGSIVLLFPGLATAMFAFMIGVAGRMYQLMPIMSYVMLFLSAMVTVVFIVVSLLIVTFGVG
jgi:hypothetical protein